MSRYEQQFFEYLDALKRNIQVQPLILGATYGSGGGLGGRAGGFIGSLPQNRVTYDLSELEDSSTPVDYSGASLVDNLNHIRYRIAALEAGGTPSGIMGISIQKDDVAISSNITTVNFEGNTTVVDNGGGKTTVTITQADSTIRGLKLRLPDAFLLDYGTDSYIEWEEVADEDNQFSIADNTKINFNRSGWYLTVLNLAISPPYAPPTEDSRFEIYLEFNNNNWNRAYYFPVTSGILINSFSVSYSSLDYVASGEYLKVDIWNGFQNGSSTESELLRGTDDPTTTSSLTIVRFA